MRCVLANSALRRIWHCDDVMRFIDALRERGYETPATLSSGICLEEMSIAGEHRMDGFEQRALEKESVSA